MESKKLKIEDLADPTVPSPFRLPPDAELRDWASLPSDVLLAIFSRINQADLLCGAGLACTSWQRLATNEPQLWRRIDIAPSSFPVRWQLAMACTALDRSAGTCDSFHGCADGDMMRYLADSAPSLKSLHVTRWLYIFNSDKELIMGAIKKLPLLERVVLPRGWVDEAMLLALIEYCPRLELLDASRSHAFSPMGDELRARLQSRIKNLRLPQERELVAYYDHHGNLSICRN